MSWLDSARARLPEHLDDRGDLPPPWARFPTYERYSIGWRMGSGEDWLGLWRVFLESVPRDRASRLAYLRRHPPAPINWARSVWGALYPDADDPDDDDPDDDDDDDDDDADAPEADPAVVWAELFAEGLVASDAAYRIWRARHTAVEWPWRMCASPREAARYWTRDLWFWSRHVAERRAEGRLDIPSVPWRWRGCAAPLRTGRLGRFERRRGLIMLTRMLCAGEVVPPWRLGLRLDHFADTFDDDMGYVDAYRLWGMSAFDDRAQIERVCERSSAPPEWRAWLDDQFYLG